MMNKKALKILLTTIVLVVSMTTCKKPVEEIPASLVINPDKTYEIPAITGNFSISISGTTTWTANSDKSWLRLDPITGDANIKSVKVDYDTNPETSDRSAIIKFIPNGTTEKTITVTQKGKIVSKPTATTQNATNVQQITATLNGSVNANGISTTVIFEYGTSTSYGQTITANQGTLTSSSETAVSANISSLISGVTYHFRVKSTNSVGTAEGADLSFTTLIQSIPTITTIAISNITQTTATSGGNVSSDGGATLISRGVCWSTNQNPTTSNNKTIDGNGLGTFSSSMTGLTANTTYYVRAYAINNAGTAYGNEISFTTTANATLPIISTNSISNIAQTTATSGGNVTADGGTTVTAKGICWNTSTNPTISNSKTTDGTGIGNFTSSLTGLSPNTTYYVKAYATNSVGTAYGNEISFTTSANTTIPTVTTSAISAIAQTSASTGGNVTSDGGTTVSSRGVCYSSTNQTPTISDSKTLDGSGTGTFTSSLIGLIANTTYYVRAYATNSNGTAYGSVVNFTTLNAILPTNGLIAYYPFNGNANDESGNVHNGTVNGATLTADRKGNLGKAYYFDGINNYIEIKPNIDFDNETEQTISVWFRNAVPDSTSGLFTFMESATYPFAQYDLYLNGKYSLTDPSINRKIYYTVRYDGNNADGVIQSENFVANTYYHLLVTKNSSGTMKMFVNGSLVATFAGHLGFNTPANTFKTLIGARYANNKFWANFNGAIDDIRIYNRALTDSEIQQLYNE